CTRATSVILGPGRWVKLAGGVRRPGSFLAPSAQSNPSRGSSAGHRTSSGRRLDVAIGAGHDGGDGPLFPRLADLTRQGIPFSKDWAPRSALRRRSPTRVASSRACPRRGGGLDMTRSASLGFRRPSMLTLALVAILVLYASSPVEAAPEGEMTWAVHVSLAP